MLERLAKDKHCGLLRKVVSYESTKFYNIDTTVVRYAKCEKLCHYAECCSVILRIRVKTTLIWEVDLSE